MHDKRQISREKGENVCTISHRISKESGRAFRRRWDRSGSEKARINPILPSRSPQGTPGPALIAPLITPFFHLAR
jgi:hypothetical protein